MITVTCTTKSPDSGPRGESHERELSDERAHNMRKNIILAKGLLREGGQYVNLLEHLSGSAVSTRLKLTHFICMLSRECVWKRQRAREGTK